MSYIFGRKPVLEALKSDKEIVQVFVSFGQKGDVVEQIIILTKQFGIKLTQLSPQKFRALEKGQNSQGVIAVISDYDFYSVEKIIGEALNRKKPLLLLLDQIQDPHNLGAILRTAECAGVDGVIITTHNSAAINETVEKTSAGAVSHLKIAFVVNINTTINLLKQKGFWVAGTSLEGEKSYAAVDYRIPLALIMGNEEKGIRKKVAEHCDFLVKIPMKGKLQSLNVSVSTGVLLFEILRQRNIQ